MLARSGPPSLGPGTTVREISVVWSHPHTPVYSPSWKYPRVSTTHQSNEYKMLKTETYTHTINNNNSFNIYSWQTLFQCSTNQNYDLNSFQSSLSWQTWFKWIFTITDVNITIFDPKHLKMDKKIQVNDYQTWTVPPLLMSSTSSPAKEE